MARTEVKTSNSVLRRLPSVDTLLRTSLAAEIRSKAGEAFAVELARRSIDQLRHMIKAGKIASSTSADEVLVSAETMMKSAWDKDQSLSIRRVINATGVVIHTNLGRAPLADCARQALADAAGYCNLEFDIQSGSRGRRGSHAEQLLTELTGAEDVLIVNNCAAAAFFVLSVFASGGDVIVSRGELVEIGGDFRIPDVLTQSGARLREVGTTNRTKIDDYVKAISNDTSVLLRVHPSNYKIVGFTRSASLAELVDLARRSGLLLYEDIGSGILTGGLDRIAPDEPVVRDSIAAGVDIVTFSGDKLLGGPQAGIIAGRRALVEKLRHHPLNRALRVNKLVISSLEATLRIHRRGELEKIPVLKMLTATQGQIEERARAFVKRCQLSCEGSGLELNVIDGVSATGGGAAPTLHPKTKLVGLRHSSVSAFHLEEKLRMGRLPVIARIVDNMVMLDLRTVLPTEEPDLENALVNLFSHAPGQNRP